MKRLSLVGLFCLLGACTSVKDSFNHWFRPGALAESKMSALVPLPVLVKPKILWQRRVGAAEQYIFSPKVVGNTLWVSGANGITQWLSLWKARGWRTMSKGAVKNEDLWRRLDEARLRHEVDWRWVKGHAGHPMNERADGLARKGLLETEASLNR